MKQAKKQCLEAVCAVEDALKRMRRAGRKNELAAARHQHRERSAHELPQDELLQDDVFDNTDSGLHAI